MSPRPVRLLHVEDDALQRSLVAGHLKKMADYAFAVRWAASEEEAVRTFADDAADCVLLDYHLEEGNGLSCLRRLRGLDPIVPIVALSGSATPEVAAELVRSGADDFLAKHDLTGKLLAQSLRTALLRAEACRQRAAADDGRQAAQVEDRLHRLFRTFADGVGAAYLEGLDEFEAAAREVRINAAQLQRLFDAVCADLDAASPAGSIPAYRLLRPVLLEVFFRLSYDQPYAKPDAVR